MKSQKTLAEKLQWIRAWLTGAEDRLEGRRGPIPEPPFTPFNLDALRSFPPARGQAPGAPAASEQPVTLTELGVPSELAQRFEVALKAMGHTRQGRVVGFRYRTTDGATYALKLGEVG